MLQIRELDARMAQQHLPQLADVLRDCVEGGASVNFMWPFTQADAEAFFAKVIDNWGDRILLAAFEEDRLIGTVQIIPATPPNQPHRADIAKLLVHRSARGKGVAQRLMEEVETVSRRIGKTLLVLDTVTGGTAERLYLRLGWTIAGVIPNYCVFPDGRLCGTTIFWKQLT